jgi:raffinose/stachyose/melibiose transport system substrate-binding protein
VLNTIGFVLLAGCFVFSFGRVLLMKTREHDPDRTLIRFVHRHLELGVREAFDEVARRYMELHPDVLVEQMAIPERVYNVWLDTKLFAGNVPDIVQYVQGNTQEGHFVNYFLPVSDVVARPNPYNRDTNLADVPWKDTFFDGLSDAPSYQPMHSNHFGIPTTVLTVRAFYNKDLMERITGRREPPQTFDELIALLDEVDAYNLTSEEKVIAFAGSKTNARLLLQTLASSQTQKLKTLLEPTNELDVQGADIQVGYLNGLWDLDNPGIRNGLQIVKRVADHLSPGFQQLNRADALFRFVLGRALMVASSSNEAQSIRLQAHFEVGAFRIPVPTPDHPVYGQNVLGPQSEASIGAQTAFSVYVGSKNREQAIDFLRFLGSQEGNAIFSRRSGWLPAVIGIEPPEELLVFKPLDDGYPGGFGLGGDGNMGRLYETNLHHLLGVGGSVDQLIEAIRPEFRESMIADLNWMVDRVRTRVPVYDTLLAARWERMESGSEDAARLETNISAMLEIITYQEEATYWRAHELGMHTEEWERKGTRK